jgi:hypothetical protein
MKLTTYKIVFLSAGILWSASPANANRVWAEWGLATATAGYDAQNDRTLANKYYLGAVGPDSVPNTIRDFIVSCAKTSSAAGAVTFKSTPSPEVGARVLAASAAFKATFITCVSTRGAAKFLATQFYISFDRKAYWVSGLNLKFSAENPSAQVYGIVYNAVSGAIPDPLSRAVLLFFAIQNPPQVDIKLEMPGEAKKFLRLMPMPSQMNTYAQQANAEAVQRSLNLIPAVLHEPQNLPHRLGQDALDVGKSQVLAQIKIGEQATQQMVDLANQGIEGVNHLRGQVKVEVEGIKLSPIPPIKIPQKPEDVPKAAVCTATFGVICPQ